MDNMENQISEYMDLMRKELQWKLLLPLISAIATLCRCYTVEKWIAKLEEYMKGL